MAAPPGDFLQLGFASQLGPYVASSAPPQISTGKLRVPYSAINAAPYKPATEHAWGPPLAGICSEAGLRSASAADPPLSRRQKTRPFYRFQPLGAGSISRRKISQLGETSSWFQPLLVIQIRCRIWVQACRPQHFGCVKLRGLAYSSLRPGWRSRGAARPPRWPAPGAISCKAQGAQTLRVQAFGLLVLRRQIRPVRGHPPCWVALRFRFSHASGSQRWRPVQILEAGSGSHGFPASARGVASIPGVSGL